MIGCWYQLKEKDRHSVIMLAAGQRFFISMCLLVSAPHCLALHFSLYRWRVSVDIPLFLSLTLSLSLLEQDPRWMIARAESTCFSRTSDGQRIIKMMSRQEEVFSWPLPSHNHGPPGPLSHPLAPPSSLSEWTALQPWVALMFWEVRLQQVKVHILYYIAYKQKWNTLTAVHEKNKINLIPTCVCIWKGSYCMVWPMAGKHCRYIIAHF